MFAELERKVGGEEGRGDRRDQPRDRRPRPADLPAHRRGDAGGAVADPGTHGYPSNRGRRGVPRAFADFYGRRFGVEIDPETEVIPAIGAKECIYNLCFAFLDPGDVALAADPGYPVYTGGPLLAGARGGADAARARARLRPRPRRDRRPRRSTGPALLFLNYPNNPTGAVAPDGLFERVVELAREHEILVVHDNAYSETTYDGYVAPSFLATPGAKEVGVEVFSLSKGFNMTGWRCAAILGNAEAIATYWRLKTNIDSGLFEAVQLAGAAALDGPRDGGRRDERGLRPPPRPGGRGAARDRRRGRRRRRGRSTSGRRSPTATPRPRSPSWCSRRPPSSSRPDRCTGRAARASSGSRSRRPTSGSPRRWSGCASTSPEPQSGASARRNRHERKYGG